MAVSKRIAGTHTVSFKKEVKNLHSENNKSLLKEIKEDRNK